MENNNPSNKKTINATNKINKKISNLQKETLKESDIAKLDAKVTNLSKDIERILSALAIQGQRQNVSEGLFSNLKEKTLSKEDLSIIDEKLEVVKILDDVNIGGDQGALNNIRADINNFSNLSNADRDKVIDKVEGMQDGDESNAIWKVLEVLKSADKDLEKGKRPVEKEDEKEVKDKKEEEDNSTINSDISAIFKIVTEIVMSQNDIITAINNISTSDLSLLEITAGD